MKFCYSLILFSFLCFAFPASAIEMQKSNGEIVVKSATTAEVENLFKQYNFNSFNKIKTRIPRIFLLHLPTDWKDIPDSDAKQKTFIRILLPLTMKVNEAILEERLQLETMYNHFLDKKSLSKKDINSLENMAKKYDVFTRLKNNERYLYIFSNLLKRIDEVPPSIVVASAAIYSNWGTSRIALEANSLYLDEIWYNNKEGLKPIDDKDADYRYKTYDSLEDCISARLLKINSHINYEYLRSARQVSRGMDRPFYGPNIVAALIQDSNLKNIAGLIDYTLSYHRLRNIDYLYSLEDIK